MDDIKFDDQFVSATTEREPSVFIQWKGTDVCMDFYCDCGAHCHFDGDHAYCVKCQHCGTVWEMPCHIYPRKADERTHPYHIESAKLLEPDQSFCDDEGNALPASSNRPEA